MPAKLQMDSNNPVVQFCAEGMQAEATGQFDAALSLFTRAWEQSQTDFEACIAAHYLARHQASPAEALRWNQVSLDRANRLRDDSVAGFYPSLYLNLGKSYEDLGNMRNARTYYELAAEAAGRLGYDRYADTVRDAITRGLERVA